MATINVSDNITITESVSPFIDSVSARSLTISSSTSSAASYTTASITPTPNSLVLIWIISSLGANAPQPSSVTGNGMTWVQIQNRSDLLGTHMLTVYRALDPAPSAGAITINFGTNPNNCQWAVTEYSNVNTSGTNGSGAVIQNGRNTLLSSNTTIAVTLSAFKNTRNATTGGLYVGNTSAITKGTNFIELNQRNDGGTLQSNETEFAANNQTSVSWTWATSAGSAAAIGIELAIAPSPNISDTITITENVQMNIESAVNTSDNVTITESVAVLPDRVAGGLLTSNGGTAASSFTTASVTMENQKLILVWVMGGVTGTAANPTVTSPSLTWVMIDSRTDVLSHRILSVWRAMPTATVTEAITIDFSGVSQQEAVWAVDAYSGVNVSGTNGSGAIIQSGKNVAVSSVTTLAVTLSAFKNTRNAAAGALLLGSGTDNIVPASDFTELSDVTVNSNEVESQFSDNNHTSVSWTWTTGNATVAAVAVEIAAAPAPIISNTVTITESVVVSISGDLAVNVSDTITISESTNLMVENYIAASDTITITENAVANEENFIAVSDTITISESQQLTVVSFVNKSDTITISENVVLALNNLSDLTISVSDTIGIIDSPHWYSDTIFVNDSSVAAIQITPAVSDTVTITESTKLVIPVAITTSDTITVTENAVVFYPQPPLNINISNIIRITESVVIIVKSLGPISNITTYLGDNHSVIAISDRTDQTIGSGTPTNSLSSNPNETILTTRRTP